MKRGYRFALVALVCLAAYPPRIQAEDVVIENHGERTFYYALRSGEGAAWSKTHQIAPGEKQSHTVSNRLRISYLSSSAQFAWLEANTTYRIHDVSRGRLTAVRQVRRPTLPNLAPGEAELPAPAAAEGATTDPTTADPTASNPTADALPTGQPQAPPNADPAEKPPSAADVAAEHVDETFEGLFDITNRAVTVRVITDNMYRNAFPAWRERVRRVVAGASEYFQREYAIRLVVTEVDAWEYDGVNDDLTTRWNRLLEQSPQDVDLVVAMVGYGDYSSIKGEATYTGQLGRAAFFGQHLMVADRRDYHENRAKTILIHELGHIFGAFHVADENLMMYPGYLQLPTEAIIAGTVPFGATIDAVFAMTKGFTFRDGVASLSAETQRRIQALYLQHGLATESRQTDPITSGYEYREQRAKIVAAQMAERAQAARGVFDGLAE